MSAFDTQIQGDHYRTMVIQPAEYITRNKIEFLPGNAIKYLSRFRHKGGRHDLQKAIHCIELMIELYDAELKAKEKP